MSKTIKPGQLISYNNMSDYHLDVNRILISNEYDAKDIENQNKYRLKSSKNKEM